jgi:hypothetical protein
MDSIAFALTIRPEMEGRTRALIDEFKSQHADRYDTTRRENGLQTLRLWFQQAPVKALVIYLEADDLEEYALNRALSPDPDDDWVERQLAELTGGQLPITELVADWSRDEGHRQVESKAR